MTMEKRQSNTPAKAGDVNVLGSARTEDFKPPQFFLVAPVSDAAQNEVAKAGNWYSPELDIEKKVIKATLLFFQPGRILWNEDELGKPRCSSDDGLLPRPGGEFEAQIEQGGCAKCPMNYAGRGSCATSYAMLFQDIEDDFTFMLRVSSWSGVNAVKTMLTALQVATKGVGDTYRFPIDIQSIKKASSKGIPYFAPQFLVKGKEAIEGSNAEVLKRYAAQYSGVSLATVDAPPADEAEKPAEEEKPRRRRRTKAEMEAVQEMAEAGAAAEAEDEPTPAETDEEEDDLY